MERRQPALEGTAFAGKLIELLGQLLVLRVQLGELPGVQESVGLLGERVAAAEASMSAWSVNWDAVEAKLGLLEKRVNASGAAAK